MMKLIFKIAVIATTAVLIGCSDLESLFEKTQASFIELTANGLKSSGGTAMETTTMLTLIFDRDIDGLSAADITISAGNTGAAKGTLTRIRMGEYNMAVTGISLSGTVTVAVSKSGYDISDSQRTVEVYFSTLELPANTFPAAFNGLTADGWTMESTTKVLFLTFDRDIGRQSNGLSAADITLTGSTGAVKGTLSKGWSTGVYELSLSGITATGTVTVTVAQTVSLGNSSYFIVDREQTVNVYKYDPSAIPVHFTKLTANGSSTETTTKLTLTFEGEDIAGLSAADITLTPGSTGAVKGALTKTKADMGTGEYEYELSLSGITAPGSVSVTVAKPGYAIANGTKSVNVSYYGPGGTTSVSFTELAAVDGSSTDTTTKLTLTFNRDIEGLSAADITLSPGTTGANKGALTRIRTGVYELSLTGITANGTVTVSVSKTNYTITGGPRTANVYYYAPTTTTAVSFTGLAADGSATSTTTKLTLTFNNNISGLNESDVTLSPGSTGASKGVLTRTGTGVYELSLTGITAGGTVTVSVANTKPGYTITGGSRTVTVYLYTPPENNFVKKVTFTGNTATVTFNNLNRNDIYLVKVNTSGFVVNAYNTGGATASISGNQSISGNLLSLGEELPRMGHPAADELSANPPPIVREASGARTAFAPLAAFIPPVVGAKRDFWVENGFNSRNFVERQATLRAVGQYGNIWVMDENYGSGASANKITDSQAQTLAQKFDQIYPLETKLIGYEYGGGPGGDGGKDGDPKVQILVYDIVDTSGTAMAAGYFWSKDFYTNAQLGSSYKSNLAEIFYIDASQVRDVPVYIYSALIHEFQHMIHFNQKYVKRGISSATWYNEMLSMMAEDVIGPMIGIPLTDPKHTIRVRMPTALYYYHAEGISEWGTLSSRSYATKSAFGAYLMRNYGGAELLQRLISNNTTNNASITSALSEFSSGLTFEQALAKYGEAMIFSGPQKPAGVASFDNTVTKTISGTAYTVTGFDVWKDFTVKGPAVLDLNQIEMRPHSITIHSADGWKNKSGNVTITLQRPTDPNVTFYLMAK
jgi:hypothetical protein